MKKVVVFTCSKFINGLGNKMVTVRMTTSEGESYVESLDASTYNLTNNSSKYLAYLDAFDLLIEKGFYLVDCVKYK